MKITKARLKEIIQEELEREEEPDFGVSGAEDLRTSIAQDQAGRMADPDRKQEIKDDLLILYRKMNIHGPTIEIVDMIEDLELELQDLEV
mgnify:CR=1 FL=1|tara:strand:- start:265 stop:534 length:270 start_codon:yes stop_codon:yes gene_type:complete